MKIAVLLALLSVSECSIVIGQVGQSVTLPCRYDIKRNGACSMCWNRGEIPNSGCSNPLISTDGNKVTQGDSRKYQLLGRLDRGDVSLTILNLTESDAGRYGCRVEIPGWFNDQKHHFELQVIKGSPTTTGTPGPSETSTRPAQSTTAGQLTSTQDSKTSSSSLVKLEQENTNVVVVLVLVLFGVITVLTVIGVFILVRRWRQLNKMPRQQQQISTVTFSLTPSALQLHRQSSAVENIYQIEGGEYESCP
ncbi:hepatitis A virus cellular receptor 1 homolog isoform X2 [Cheilinus undulatus]|uniref:hepatitis A virus cellular receptor 1 homolog isoform X2 n=1 Tax=Cheilinus undulatus TaxID=241271 RepID=UPI001BD247CD|nr:hepatitis A virus cellular receptor 1 homolog isoform X2 [Cheilinus undulatus]